MFEFVWTYYFSSMLVGGIGLALLIFFLFLSIKESKYGVSDEYVRGDVTTDTVTGYFSIFKRGMKGVYQHCDAKHLHRYVAEYEFRYKSRVANGFDDHERTEEDVIGIVRKRLTYRLDNEVIACAS